MASSWKRDEEAAFRTGYPERSVDRMSVKRWMRDWRARFGYLGVEVLVADVGQSSVVVNVPEKSIVLSPRLTMVNAEELIGRLYKWWRRQPNPVHTEPCSLVSR